MRSFISYLGLGIILISLWMIVQAGISMYDLHNAKQLSFELLKSGFWFKDPNNYFSGLTPNGKWASLSFGGLMLFFIGKYISNLSTALD